jgi:hypothetical protein
VHNVLSPTWQRERMLAELEVQRKVELHRRTTRQLRAAISRESAAAKAAQDVAGQPSNPPGADTGKRTPDWAVQLMKTPHGQRLVCELLSGGRRPAGAARRVKRGRGSHSSRLGTASSHSYLASPLASISETNPLGEEQMALLEDELAEISGAASLPSSHPSEEADDYIMADMSKFTVDAYGFIVPIEH